ncbi:hypothetical protein BE04_14895 [Sorangium cellulosum]|uniref:DUF4389 domain-containing protein n=2 Tax=Sorangium cellulosum TaxID=56 RepID=A0A150PRC3_SORCE|nr:DUF4389 domain-containing protein [Sorangium cellulosum]AGP35918.1 hypothetical protein SCE1572_16255 [Sorangium cellulosum So0157-2]KYF58234.1 hypothetical protein BE04_14895 [Sorangium cellulosum]
MTSYPVTFAVARPWKLDRIQLLARVLLLTALSLAGVTLGFVMTLAYLVLPAVASALVYQKGSARFLAEDGPRLTRALAWLEAAFAYLFLLTDKLPLDRPAEAARLDIDPTGAPTAKGALLRLFTSLPSAIVLALLSCAAYLAWLVSAVSILFTERVPTVIYDFQCGVLRWQARLLAYHASLVDKYPPFAFDPGPMDGTPRDHASTFA